jgi:hypothetical protein
MAVRRIFRCIWLAALGLAASCAAPTENGSAGTQYLVTASIQAPAAGEIVTIKAQLADAEGRPVADAGRRVTWTREGAGGGFLTAATSTDAAGLASVQFQTGTTAAVSYVLTATDDASLTGKTTIATVAGAASKYVLSVSTLSPAPGATVTISAQLSDANGNAVGTAGKTVSWVRIGAAGSLGATSSTTDATGVATVAFTASVTAGAIHSVTATDNTGLAGSSPQFATVAGPATRYLVTVSTPSPAAGGAVTVTARLTDAEGNTVTTAGRTVTWTKTAAGGSFSAATSQTNAGGVATIVLTVGTTAGVSQTVTATDNSSFTGTSPEISVVAGPASGYLVSASSSSPVAGSTVTIAAQLADGHGNPVAGGGRIVAWTASGSGGVFGSATSTTAANGVATVGFTTGVTAGVTYAVTATQTGSSLTGTSAPLTTVAGPAARYVVTPSLSTPSAGATITVTAQIADANGNAVASSGRTVTWTKTGTGGSFSAATSTTNSSGIATVSFTTSTTVGATHTVTATDNGGLAGTSGDITTSSVVAVVRFASAVLVVDSAGTITPTVSARDANGAAVSGAGITLVTRNTGAATVSGATVSGVRPGQTFLIATSAENPNARDSALVLVANVGAPVVTASVPRFDLATDTTFTVSIVVDMRASGETLGAATLQVTWNPGLLTYLGNGGGTAGVNAVVNASGAASGSVTMAMASSAGFSGAVEIRTLTFKASATAGRAGTLAVVAADLSGAGTFSNLLPKLVSGTYSLKTR